MIINTKHYNYNIEALTEIAFIVNDYRHEEITAEEAIEKVADVSAKIAELTSEEGDNV